MVQVVGDGSFYFGGPCSVFAVAQQYKLPILAIVLDNSGWSAVKESTLRVFPEGEAKSANEFQAGLMPDAEFSKIGEAFGAYGEKVDRSGRRAGGARALCEGGARRPRRDPARPGDEAVICRLVLQQRCEATRLEAS